MDIGCITDKSNWIWLFSLVVVYSLCNPRILGSIPFRGLTLFFFTDISFPATVVLGASIVTIGAQGQSNGCRVNKNLEIIII